LISANSNSYIIVIFIYDFITVYFRIYSRNLFES